MGKHRVYERISYNLERSFNDLQDKAEDFKEGYQAAINYVNAEVKRNQEYYENREKGEM